MPTTHIGGTRATAIARPARAEIASFLSLANIATAPATRATPRSSRLGLVRFITSLPKLGKATRWPTPIASSTQITTPSNRVRRARRNIFSRPRRISKAMACSGRIQGATTMAPITTPALLASRPRVAIRVAPTVSTTNTRLKLASCSNSRRRTSRRASS